MKSLLQLTKNKAGEVVETKVLKRGWRPSDFKRLRGPFFYGEMMYALKKFGSFEVEFEDGALVFEIVSEVKVDDSQNVAPLSEVGGLPERNVSDSVGSGTEGLPATGN